MSAGQNAAVKQVSDRIRLVSFRDYDLGYFDDETCRLEPIENPFSPNVLLEELKYLRHERLHIRERAAVSDQHHDRDIECRQVLLALEFSIDSQEDVELAVDCKTPQVAVAFAGSLEWWPGTPVRTGARPADLSREELRKAMTGVWERRRQLRAVSQ